MSRRSPSLSEGEIMSDGEGLKATSTRTENKNNKVNGSTRPASSRPLRNGNVSRDIHYHFRDDDGGLVLPRDTQPRDRDRSRSPYRADKAPRGEKRRRESDGESDRGGDPRRFKVHYEHGAQRSNNNNNRQHQPYDAVDRVQPPTSDRYDDRGLGRPPVSSRTDRDKSRSPYRANKIERTIEQLDIRGGRGNDRAPGQRQAGYSGNQDRRQNLQSHFTQGSDADGGRRQSISSRESTPKPPHEQDESSKVRISLAQKLGAIRKDEKVARSVSFHETVSIHTHDGRSDTAATTLAKQPAQVNSISDVPLTEDQLIEQRRKRREELKKKHASATPLLVQAIEQNMVSAPNTPLHDTSSRVSEQSRKYIHPAYEIAANVSCAAPSTANSPGTPQQDSAPGSPADFIVMNDEDLVNHHQAASAQEQDDGPSAADYDPSMDMQEDREKGLEHQPISNVAMKDYLAPVDIQDESTEKLKTKKDFDMFADDDDDEDMFAPEEKQPQASAGGRQARALDQSLLDNWDYPDGHYRIILGELLDGRYAVKSQLGKGTFATVVGCRDIKTDQDVAVKIACNNDTMRKAGTKEMDMLRYLNQHDPDDKKHIIRFERQFEHKNHNCLVFEHLTADLREVLKKFGRNVGINLFAIKNFARQMFLALSHMKKCKVLHADLKPDNILVNNTKNVLKVCDFGTASFAEDAEITPYLVSRFYRAPEVIMGMKYDYAIDMWSIGCTLFELYTGRILFTGADNNQMLRAIMECRGKFPIRMLKRSDLVANHFDENASFLSHEKDKITGQMRIKQMTFSNKALPGKDLKSRLSFNAKALAPADLKQLALFLDLLDKCLHVDPDKRLSPNDALRHGFIAAHSAATTATTPAVLMRR